MVEVRKNKPLFGEIELSGAKNATLPILTAAPLCGEGTILRNVPENMRDVQVLVNVLNKMGVEVRLENGCAYIGKVNPQNGHAPVEAGNIRYSLLLLPLFLNLCGNASIPNPGGCNLGDRRYDILLDTLSRIGYTIQESEDKIEAIQQSKTTPLNILFHTATTIGSENAVLASLFVNGTSEVQNANTRPEVIDLIHFLNKAGANISYHTRAMHITGVDKLHSCEYTIMQDRHEAVSYMILAAMCRGEICIRNFSTEYIREDVELLRRIGVGVYEWGNNVYVTAKGRTLQPFSMVTYPYPGINSDMQPLFAALATTIPGESIITDTRFTERFQYVTEFQKMGADIVNYENCAIVHGGKSLHGSTVQALDLRAGAALTFLGAVADGTTTIDNYYQVERGYERIVEKMQSLGVDISYTPGVSE